MGFKTKEFMDAETSFRTEEVKVPDLKDWFDGEPVWKIRGLTGNECGKCSELSGGNRKTAAEFVSAMMSKTQDEATGALKGFLSLSGDMPQDNAKRIEYLIMGSVDPVCDLELALKLNEAFPVEFISITNMILSLTGKGMILGKPMPSGTIPQSEPA